ncbi:MAG TPA: hypothetical protein VNS22_01940 [Geminicoccus sp.]|uniref:hypothetical protein n=1 Tax=Geminicoccus sp. TaxID=2024832 RepID=UPI002B7329B8|nr:hypothetical protein [Geminicoccus sp.]HWL67124.1 hypothetical protein [Geminicoccus sp.]
MLGYQPLCSAPLGYVSEVPLGYVPVAMVRFATRGWTATEDDLDPGQHIPGRLAPMTITRNLSLGGDGLMGGVVRATAGTIELDNADGALDLLAESRGLQGRTIRLKFTSDRGGRRKPRVREMATSWEGVVEDLVWYADKVEIRTRDLLSALDRPISTNVYTGQGGRGGMAALEGKTKPLGFGAVRNARAELIDNDLLIYQFHDGLARAVQAVRDMGAPLIIRNDVVDYQALVDAEVELGEVVTCRAEGLFKLGDFAAGDVTVDFLGHGEDPALTIGVWDDGQLWDDGLPWDEGTWPQYSETASGIIMALLRRAGIAGSKIEEGQFLDAERAWPHPMHLYVPTGAGTATILELVGQIAEAAGLLVSVNRSGRVYARRLTTGVGGTVISEEDIMEISRIEPPYGRPIYHAAIPYGANETVQSSNELVKPDDEIVSEATLKAYQTAYVGVADAGSSRTLGQVQTARSVTPEYAVYTTAAGAQARAWDIVRTHSPGRSTYRVTCKRKGWRLDLGDPVPLTHPRFGLASGKQTIVVGIQDNGPAREVTLDLLG